MVLIQSVVATHVLLTFLCQQRVISGTLKGNPYIQSYLKVYTSNTSQAETWRKENKNKMYWNDIIVTDSFLIATVKFREIIVQLQGNLSWFPGSETPVEIHGKDSSVKLTYVKYLSVRIYNGKGKFPHRPSKERPMPIAFFLSVEDNLYLRGWIQVNVMITHYFEPAFKYISDPKDYQNIAYSIHDVSFGDEHCSRKTQAREELNRQCYSTYDDVEEFESKGEWKYGDQVMKENLENHQQPTTHIYDEVEVFGSTGEWEHGDQVMRENLEKHQQPTRDIIYEEVEVFGSKGEWEHEDQVAKENLVKQISRPVCHIELISDHTFYRYMGSNVSKVVNQMWLIIAKVIQRLREVDLHNDGNPDFVEIIPSKLLVYTDEYDHSYPLRGIYGSDISDVIIAAATRIQSFCLSYWFVHRRFHPAQIGRTIVGGAYNNNIYRDKLKNVGIITTAASDGSSLPDILLTYRLLHLIGHSFGSHHDKIDDPRCSVGYQGSNYLMYPSPPEIFHKYGTFSFSECSKKQIGEHMKKVRREGKVLQVVTSRGDSAFPVCGNNVVEEGEECDCGSRYTCRLFDKCCAPPGGSENDQECTLRISSRPGTQCSPSQGPCCSTNCQFKVNAKCLGQTQDECTEEQLCNGSSFRCPTANGTDRLEDGTACMASTKTCREGKCVSNVCKDGGLEECPCPTDGDQSCEVCCLSLKGNCMPASILENFPVNRNIVPKALKMFATSCRSWTHVCNAKGVCVPPDDPSIHKPHVNVTTPPEPTQPQFENSNYIIGNWLNFIIVFLVITAVAGGFYVSSLLKRRRDQNRTLEKEVAKAKEKVDAYFPEYENENTRCLEYNALCRLVAVFPTVPIPLLKEILDDETESRAIEMLRDQGYVMNRFST